MALGSDKFRDWHVTQPWPLRHEKSAGQGLGLLAPEEETQGKRSFSPAGTTVSDCGTWPIAAILLAVWRQESKHGQKLGTL